MDIDEIPDNVVYELYQYVRKLHPQKASSADIGPEEDDDYDDDGAYVTGRPPKSKGPRKNKPMSAREQEAKLAQVRPSSGPKSLGV